MNCFRRLGKVVPIMLIMAFLSIYIAPVQAAMVGNEQLLAQSQHEMTKQQVLSELDKQSVQDKLVALGVEVDDAKHRIQQLSPQELAQLQQEFEQMPAGSGIIGALLVIFIVFVVTDMLGATDVFGFVHNINH